MNQEEITVSQLNQLIADKELGLTKNTTIAERRQNDPQDTSKPKDYKYYPKNKKPTQRHLRTNKR